MKPIQFCLIPLIALLAFAANAGNYAITSASVLASDAGKPADLVAGESIAAGQVVYKSTSTVALLASATNSVRANAFGIAVNSASAGQPLRVISEDPSFSVGATMVTGAVLVLSATPGAIAPVSDLTNGWYPTVLGIANSGTRAAIKIVRGTSPTP